MKCFIENNKHTYHIMRNTMSIQFVNIKAHVTVILVHMIKLINLGIKMQISIELWINHRV